MNRIDAESETLIPDVASPLCSGYAKGAGHNDGKKGSPQNLITTHALKAEGHDASEDGTGRGVPLVAFTIQKRAGAENINQGPQGKGYQEGVAYTLESRHHVQSLATPNAVRRLLPLECERLQGFPDGHTAIPGAKDSPRYKAIGNSMAVPCMSWIGKQIANAMVPK